MIDIKEVLMLFTLIPIVAVLNIINTYLLRKYWIKRPIPFKNLDYELIAWQTFVSFVVIFISYLVFNL